MALKAITWTGANLAMSPWKEGRTLRSGECGDVDSDAIVLKSYCETKTGHLFQTTLLRCDS